MTRGPSAYEQLYDEKQSALPSILWPTSTIVTKTILKDQALSFQAGVLLNHVPLPARLSLGLPREEGVRTARAGRAPW
jgi:hypothetical protein